MKAPLDYQNHRLVVCLGPGGVGKTTLSAALALNAAMTDRRVDVMTVDPAPRLLDALGLDPARSEPQPVALNGIAKGRHRIELRAMKLDPKTTFDAIVRRYASSESARDAILGNRIYRNLSSALAGVGDYMAMEKLLELHSSGDADLIVLDTPPSSEAIDFLDAPRRLLDLLNSRAITLLGKSRRIMSGGLVDIAARAVLSAFDRVTGLNLLGDVQAFVEGFDGMYSGFAERAEKSHRLLRAPETLVVIVTTPEPARIQQVAEFATALIANDLRVDAVVVNRVMPEIPDPQRIPRGKIAPALRRKLVRNARDFAALKEREAIALASLKKSIPGKTRLLFAPDLGREPRTLADLAELARNLHA
jgi:anion-transporting  ArsA/GET3 family ATPase